MKVLYQYSSCEDRYHWGWREQENRLESEAFKKWKKEHFLPGASVSDREGNGTPLQYSCLENPMDRGAW